jgi:hypothetical protein
MVFSCAIQAIARPESQSTRPEEPDGAFGHKDTHELLGGRVIFTHANSDITDSYHPIPVKGRHPSPGSVHRMKGVSHGTPQAGGARLR